MLFLKSKSLNLMVIMTIGIVVSWFSVGFSSQINIAGIKPIYTTKVTPLYSTSSGKDIEGELTPGTPIFPISSSKNNKIKVSIDGWSMNGAKSIIYYADGKRIILLSLKQNAISKISVLKRIKDQFGNEWEQVQITGWVDFLSTTDDLPTVWEAARKIYEARCSACHALRPPTMFSANQWPSVLNTMAKNAALDPEQKALVVKYMQMHAKDMVHKK